MRLGSRSVRIIVGAAILSAACCVPKRVYWSPDGQRALILTEQKTWATTADGELLKTPQVVFEQVAWFPDSKRFVGVHTQPLSTWAEVKKELTDEQVSRIAGLETEFREAIAEADGSLDNVLKNLHAPLSSSELLALWIYTRERSPERLQSELGDKWADLSKLTLNLHVLQSGQIGDGEMTLGPPVARMLDEIALASLHVSPNGKLLAYVVKNAVAKSANGPSGGASAPADTGGALMLLAFGENTRPTVVADFAAWRSDFTPDSRHLIYATTKPVPQGENVVLGSIQARQVVDEQGNIQVADAEDLAGIVYFPDTKIVCLEDGHILFSAAAISLPMATADAAGGLSLFSMDPEHRATIAPMLTRSVESKAPTAGLERGIFDVRPDGHAVTLVGSEDGGEVAYYDFPSGQLEFIVPREKEDWKLFEQPAWRTNEELSLVVPPGHEWGSPDRPELILYSIESKQTRAISKSWPAELMDAFNPNSSGGQAAQSQPASGS